MSSNDRYTKKLIGRRESARYFDWDTYISSEPKEKCEIMRLCLPAYSGIDTIQINQNIAVFSNFISSANDRKKQN